MSGFMFSVVLYLTKWKVKIELKSKTMQSKQRLKPQFLMFSFNSYLLMCLLRCVIIFDDCFFFSNKIIVKSATELCT